MWDLENPNKALWEVKGHTGLINAIDGCGGQAKGYGAPEVATCGQDGTLFRVRAVRGISLRHPSWEK